MIQFHQEDCTFVPRGKSHIRTWINAAISEEQKSPGSVNFIFCSDHYLLKINEQYLNHDDLTDIITFDYCEGSRVSGDIFISVERIEENAQKFKVPFRQELYRVIIHGILHLCGYHDKKPGDKKQMTAREDHYLQKLPVQLV